MYQNREYKNRFRILKGGLISLVVASNLYSAPSGGTVVSGNATINQNGNTTNINQSSQKASINWQDFSIKSNETVNFNQPSYNSITLNRVIGNEKSIIDGALNANGQVWLLNSNGTIFNKNAKVNTAGLLVTTKELSDKDFQAGNYNFKGDSKESIENLGNIDSKKYASFVANSVINNGEIKVHSGTINLIGASEFSVNLDENSNISLKVNKGVVDALVENNHLLIANGGNVYLTTNAKNELLKGVVNNTGIIEATSLDDLQSEVILFAHGGTANISGSIIAKNSFVETSGKDLNITNEAKITAKKWLLDPVNVTIDNSNGTIGNEKVGATVIQNSLNSGTNIEIQADNNINVNEAITWNTAQELTLNAGNNIYINKEITATNNSGKLALKYGQATTDGETSDYYVNAKVNLKAGQNFSTQKGTNAANLKNYTVITSLGSESSATGTDLQGINGNLNANYVLGADINASGTSGWNDGKGFNPIGGGSNGFNGTFDGLGHTISYLSIDRPTLAGTGLFGYTSSSATIRNVGLVSVLVHGKAVVGGLVGLNYGTINNSYVTIRNGFRLISGEEQIGGFVGANNGTISNSYVVGSGRIYLKGGSGQYAGGFAGLNNGSIKNSYADVNIDVDNPVSSSRQINGFTQVSSRNENVYYISDGKSLGYYFNDKGDYSADSSKILTALRGRDGWVVDGSGFEGYGIFATAITLPQLKTFFTQTPTSILFQGGYGTEANPYTITNWTQLQNINNSNILTQNYYFNLLNNLSSSTSDYTNLASNSANGGLGWNPIGDNTNKFIGTFDGKGFTISDLYINRPSTYVGLFGYINNSTIKNLGLTNVDITGSNYVGGLVGYINHGTITNSYANGKVSGIGYIGGLVGYNGGNGIITNSYASGTVSGNSYIGGLVGYGFATITNSFYDNTKFNGNGVGYGIDDGVTGLTTEQMKHGTVYKTAGWDIVADSNLAEGTPILKFDSVNNKYVWAIAPKTIVGNLENETVTYNGLLQNLSSIYTSQAIFGTAGMSFKFVDDNGDIVGYKNAGTYSNISVELLGTDEFTVAGVGTKGTLTINKANATVTANSDTSKVYNGLEQNVSGFTVSGLVNGETESVLTGLTGTTTTGKNAGVYNTNIAGTDTNYNLTFTQGTLEITKANATVTVADNSKVYNGHNQNFDFSVDGLVNGETKDVLSGLTGLQTSSKNVGIYTSNIAGTDTNYNLTFNQGDLEITKANLDIVAISDSKVYNGQTQSVSGYSFGANGLLGSDTTSDFTLTNTTTTSSSKNVGIYNTNLSGSADNYNINFTQGTLEITKADLTLNGLTAQDKTYDGNSSATVNKGALTLVGKFGSDVVEFDDTNLVASFEDKNAGTVKQVNISGVTLSGTDANNYNVVAPNSLTANIDKADATVTVNDSSKVYNGYNQNFDFSVDGLVNGETKDILSGLTGLQTSSKNVGIYTSNIGGTDTNYNLTFNQGDLEITKKDLAVTVTDKSKVVDGQEFSGGSVVYKGFVAGEDESVFTAGNLEFTGDSQGAKDVGKYSISASTSAFEADNYNISYIDGILSIVEKPTQTNSTVSKEIDSIHRLANTNLPINQEFTTNANQSSQENSSSNELTPDSLNQNVEVLALGQNQNIRVINGGIKMPENPVTKEEDIIK
ncbi:hypothetical protein CRU94_01370 [Arcobacter sp. AHV-9/2010]|uniref:MBG domain-containing protein n=1 Tax=Arcobacter sp. AHV-9/2010 TaxID=2021861 RepID=UPI00100B0114|nr:MBG domain-containing protein [Arcobacter sp. CECT 9299]RXJ96788.1 hypothetical protein CRU94_01370 [Arcobacter sp. CECT 9299]